MNTRHALPGSSLRQNSFASSPDIERGLLGNLVALKAATVESAADRELLYWLQGISHHAGGLAAIAAEAVARMTARNADLAAPVQSEDLSALLVKLEKEEALQRKAEQSALSDDELAPVTSPELRALRVKAKRLELQDQRYTIRENFLQTLPEKLAALCLDPEIRCATSNDNSTREYQELIAILHELKAEHAAQTQSSFAHTTLSRAVWNEILDAHELGGTVLLHNSTGSGKSHAAKACCAAYPGRARYVDVPATNDETGFLREINKALGVCAGLSFKAIQMRERTLAMLLPADVVLVLDSAQWLFPVSDYRYALPNRLNWVLSALSERGVPVVMIADSKFFDTLGLAEARTGWNRSKFVNQLSRVGELPAALPKEDVEAVAASLLPDGERAAQRKLADYMIVAQRYLHSGEPAAQRARRIAARNNRQRVTLEDMNAALEAWGVPAVKSMDAALKRADAAAARCKAKVRNWRPDTEAQTAAKGKRRNQIVTSSDLAQPPQDHPAGALQDSGSNAAGEQFHQRGASPRVVTRPGRGVIPSDLATV